MNLCASFSAFPISLIKLLNCSIPLFHHPLHSATSSVFLQSSLQFFPLQFLWIKKKKSQYCYSFICYAGDFYRYVPFLVAKFSPSYPLLSAQGVYIYTGRDFSIDNRISEPDKKIYRLSQYKEKQKRKIVAISSISRRKSKNLLKYVDFGGTKTLQIWVQEKIVTNVYMQKWLKPNWKETKRQLKGKNWKNSL